jgi:hypothetical protein
VFAPTALSNQERFLNVASRSLLGLLVHDNNIMVKKTTLTWLCGNLNMVIFSTTIERLVFLKV